MTTHILSMYTWLELPIETREKLRVAFDIPKSSCVEVIDNHVVCDGTLVKDLMVLTVERMQNYLNRGSAVITDETDFIKLFDMVLERLNQTIKPEESVKPEETNLTNVIENKNAKKKSK